MDKLTEIMAHKRREIAPLLRPVFADELKALNRSLPRPPSFAAALRRPDGKLAIARIDRAVGCTGTVYLRVPGAKGGAGKVHLALQNRTVEYQAVTAGEEIPTGKPVKVVAVVNADTVEVEAV